MRNIAIIAAACLALSACPAAAEDINAVMDGFYNGLAAVIEGNMDDPEACVAAVDRYYDDNSATVQKVRELSARYMEEMAPMMKEYESMSEEELAALEQKSAGQRFDHTASAGAGRYTEAMKAFTMRYPQQGMKIATQAFQFMPGTPME